MNNVKKPPQDEDAGNVPDDFPKVRITGAVPGAQPKFLANLYEGRYYLTGCTPPEVLERWHICKDLAGQIAVKSLESKAGKSSNMSETSILAQYYRRLVTTRWTSVDEAQWVIRKVAELIGWDITGMSWGLDRNHDEIP